MADVLFMLGLPRGRIDREAHGEDGIWNRKLRKTKFGQNEMELNALANWLFDYKEIEDRTEQNRRYRDLKVGGEALIRLVRADPTMGDIILGRSAVHGSLKTNFPAPCRESPEPEAKDPNAGLRNVFVELSKLSGRDAAAELNRRGIKTPNGGKWHPEQVRRARKSLAIRR
jgi:hypothetical protein